jgi:hypothetical protein
MSVDAVLIGGIGAAYLVAALVFLRFWRSSHDRFFIFFFWSFLIEGVNRVLFFVAVGLDEYEPVYYLVRVVSYGLIIIAVVDKNRAGTRTG